MYGRNELIARYIKLRTGKTRTRKQVSSHIQVLARRKAREIQAKLKDQAAKDKAMQSMATMSSAQIISATAFHSKMALPGLPRPAYPAVSGFWQGALSSQAGSSQDVKPFSQQPYAVQPPLPLPGFESSTGLSPSPSSPAWQGRRVASSKLWMLEFSAFLEQQQDQDTYNKHLFVHIGQSSATYNDPYLEAVDIRQIYDKFPEKKGGLKELFEKGPANAFFLVKFWADLNTNIEDESRSFYGVSSQYESRENMVITCSTKVCSFGKQVVEKVETEYARYENGYYSYRIHRSPLCEYMINFIHKLKHLPEKYMMNSVLENFTILQQLYRKKPGMTMSCARLPQNISKNRYRDISPYDATRVILKSNEDYINANYINMEIPSSTIINQYIACQGPLPNTCPDFWQMTWEQGSSMVVMLTTQVERGRVKCHQYWPEPSGSSSYGNFQITCHSEEGNPAYVFREMTLTNLEKEESRQLTQIQYIAWPDHGVPDDSSDFLDFVCLVRKKRAGREEPVVVHCSAGIGRTGVLITMETAMCLIECNQPVYPLDIVRTMRDQRAMMIQTPSQYRFVCEAILKVYEEGFIKPLQTSLQK